MPAVNAEVQDIIKDIRDFGFEVEIGGKHAKVYKRGTPVLFEKNHGVQEPVTIPLTPSDSRWRDNLLAHLRRAKVVPKNYGRNGSGPRTDLSREEKVRIYNAAKSAASEERRERRVKPLQARLARILEDLGAKRVELVRLAMESAEKKDAWRPKTMASATTSLIELLKGAPHGMSDKTLDFWENIADELDGAPQALLEERRAAEKEEQERQAAEAEQARKEAEAAGAAEIGPLHGDTLFRCEECNETFESKATLGRHQTKHKTRECDLCDWTGSQSQYGQHRRWRHPGAPLNADYARQQERKRAKAATPAPTPIPPPTPVPPVQPTPEFLPVLWEAIGTLRGHGERDLADQLREFATAR